MTDDERKKIEHNIGHAKKIIRMYEKGMTDMQKEFGPDVDVTTFKQEIDNQNRYIRAWTVAMNINADLVTS